MSTYQGELVEGQIVIIDAAYGASFKDCEVALKGSVVGVHFSQCRLDVTADQAVNMGYGNIFDHCEFKTPPSS